jgi:hypothetical protein
MAEALASLNIRSISTGLSPVFALAVARPLSTARAAEAASRVSVLSVGAELVIQTRYS